MVHETLIDDRTKEAEQQARRCIVSMLADSYNGRLSKFRDFVTSPGEHKVMLTSTKSS